MKILGHKFVDFKDKDGNAVCGHSLFVSYHDDNVTGEATDKLWVKPDLMDTAVRDAGLLTAGECVGMEIDPTYNKYGKICAVAFTPSLARDAADSRFVDVASELLGHAVHALAGGTSGIPRRGAAGA